jgi:WD40 repeat protein
LILARCNYAALRERMVQRLRELSPIEIRELVLPKSVKSLYTTIKVELGDEVPQALMVFGLESVSDIKIVLTSSNYIREEFSKNFPFPLVLWINDEVQQKLLRLVPDLESWATSVEFKFTTDELLDFLRQKTDEIFASKPTPNLENCFEIEAACKDLQRWEQDLEPNLEASLEFVRGLDDFSRDKIDDALEHYQKSLAFWQQGSNGSRGVKPCAPASRLERQGILLLDIALCYYRKAELHRAQSQRYWEQARDYLQQCLDVFEQAQRLDLVTKHIGKLGEVLRRLQAWKQLQVLAEKALALHQGDSRQLAQDYGFLAEVALEESNWNEAHQLAQQALQVLDKIPNLQPYEQGLYRFVLARSQRHLGQVQEAIANLEQAREKSKPQYNPELYIGILGELRSLYFEQGEYLAAFRIKQEQLQVEHQYGFRAFIGAGYLLPKRYSVNPALEQVELQGTIAQEIAVSSREQDVKRLKERLSSTEHKLIVIHGQSGVGKSSILQAGLIPALHQQAIGERDTLPILLRVYTDWVGTLGKGLAEAFEEVRGNPLPVLMDSTEAILEQLRKNADRNLLTVLIFDQFEEFFFVYTDQKIRQPFYDFLRLCLDIPFVKVIFSLREDYLHYLLECDRLLNLTVINNNILDKNIRYYLGNFSPNDATVVVRNLTEKSQFPLEPELVNALVRDLAGEVGEVRPIELQIVGAQLQTEKITTLEQYRQCGTKEKLVERFLEDVIKDCGSENEQAARLVLYLLTNENSTRPLKTRADLELELEVKSKTLDLILEILVESGLVIKVPATPANRYQLVHDYLVPFVRQQQSSRLIAELEKEREQRKLTEAKLNQALKRQLSTARRSAITLGILTSLISGFALVAVTAALNGYATILTYQGFQREGLDTLINSIKAGKQLKRCFWAVVDARLVTLLGLQGGVYFIDERNRLEGHSANITDISFSPDDKLLASSSKDGTVRLWEIDGKEIVTLQGHRASVTNVEFSPNGEIIASASEDKTVKLWTSSGRLIKTLAGHSNSVIDIKFSPNGKSLSSFGENNTVQVRNLDSGEVKTIKDVEPSDWFTTFPKSPNNVDPDNGYAMASSAGFITALSSDAKIAAEAGADNIVRLRSLENQDFKTSRNQSSTNADTVTNLSFSPNSQLIASVNTDNITKIWQRDGTLLHTLQGRNSDISFSPDSQTLASVSIENVIKLQRLNSEESPKLKGHSNRITSISFSSDGQLIASASNDKTVKLWQQDGILFKTLVGHNGWVTDASFSPDGQLIASASNDKTVKLWQQDGTLLKTLEGHDAGVSSVSFNSDGQLIASVSALNETAKLWRRDGTLLRALEGRNRWVEFSPDSKLIASSGSSIVKLWQSSGNLERLLEGHKGFVNSVSFSPDSECLFFSLKVCLQNTNV